MICDLGQGWFRLGSVETGCQVCLRSYSWENDFNEDSLGIKKGFPPVLGATEFVWTNNLRSTACETDLRGDASKANSLISGKSELLHARSAVHSSSFAFVFLCRLCLI